MMMVFQNENYGYSVSTRGKWVAVGNPSFNSWPPATASVPTSGSVDVFGYDKTQDFHVLTDTLNKHLSEDEEILLAAEIGDILHTEPTGSVDSTADLDIAIDEFLYRSAFDNDYGRSVDIHNGILLVGYTHYYSRHVTDYTVVEISGSGGVDVYNLNTYDLAPYSGYEITPLYSTVVGLNLRTFVDINPGWNWLTQYARIGTGPWRRVQKVAVNPVSGGTYVLISSLTVWPTATFKYELSVDPDAYITTIKNPHQEITRSFGFSVSSNDDWMAIGSPLYSQSRGAVYLYRRFAAPTYANLSWSFHSVVTASDGGPGDMFGWSVELNAATGSLNYLTTSYSYPNTMIVGTNRPSGSKVYYYEISGSEGISGSILSKAWMEKYRLSPSYPAMPLTYYPAVYPTLSGSYVVGSTPDRFGYDVSMYKDTIAVGAPFDRTYYEFSGSSEYQQGAFYIFERCSVPDYGFYLKMKSNGDDKCFKSHRLGYSVSVFKNNLVVGCPKISTRPISLYQFNESGTETSRCHIQGSLYQAHFCNETPESKVHGQFYYLSYNTNSLDWDINNAYQVKKRFYSPYRGYGFCIDTDDQFIAVGAPMLVSGSHRLIDVAYTGSVDELDTVAGQTYIYNLKNYKHQFHVGNVFYRNGKIVVITSGSQYKGLYFNNVTDREYEYDLSFKNKQTLHEKQVICSVEPGEFNVSTNPTSLAANVSDFDINGNGTFDFQDMDIILRYMNYRRTGAIGNANTNWSSSVLSEADEISWYNYLNDSGVYVDTDGIYSSSFSTLDSDSMFYQLDFNQDNLIDLNDQTILWKYFANRLEQKNFTNYITVNSERRTYSDLMDYLNQVTCKNLPPTIKSEFFDYERLSTQDKTGSYLTPMVTTIGLYQGADLVAVAKLGNPIKLFPDYPYNFVVKMDF